MRYKLFTTALALMSYAFSYAQVPNSHFENWSTVNIPTLDDWNSIGNVSKTTDAYSGSSAIRLDNVGANESFGAVTNAQISENFNGGHPFTDNPLSIVFAVKYDLAPGDVGKVYAIFKKQGQLLAAVDFTVNGSSADTFEVYKVPIQWVLQTPPDSVVIAMTTYDLQAGNVNGDGYMIIDHLRFESIGVEDGTVPNNDFENWGSRGIDHPTGWYTTDLVLLEFLNTGSTVNSVVKESTNPHDGAYSVHLKSAEVEGDIIPGVMLTGDGIENAENPAFPVTENWAVLHGLYKYQPDEGDTAFIMVGLFSNGTPIAYGTLALSDSTRMDQYTYFSLDITYGSGLTADSATILITTANLDHAKGTNSQLWIDNVQLARYALSVSGPDIIPAMLYPNPAHDVLSISSTAVIDHFIVFDALGNEVLQGTGNAVSTADLESGVYYIQVFSGTALSTKTKFVKL